LIPAEATPSRRFFKGLAIAAAFLVCALLVLFAFDRLARHQLREHLNASASATLGALLHGHSPHRWNAQQPADIVAGRVFGSDDAHFVDDGFRFRSEGRPVDIGLVLKRDLDLLRYSTLETRFQSAHAGTISVLVRETLDGPLCLGAPLPFAAEVTTVSIALDRLSWTCEDTAPKAPERAAMLRLRFDLSKGNALTLVEAALQPQDPPDAEKLDRLELPILPAPDEAHAFERALARIANDRSAGNWRVVQLPLDGRIEQVLAARDRVYAVLPDAIIIGNGSFNDVAKQARKWQEPPPAKPSAPSSWIQLTAYALLLLALRLRPPLGLRLRGTLELIGICALPLWLVVGGHIGDNLTAPQLSAIAITLGFAFSLLIGGAPAQPSARTLKRGWWVALGSILLTVALIVGVAGAPLPESLPGYERIGHYLVWAAVQQFLICVLVSERIERVTGSARLGLIGAAIVFGLLHTPNAMLMQLTFVAGLIWVWNWQRHRALLANIVAHAACGLLLTLSLPVHWLHSAEVSARFFLGGL
jgi:membrane protease YdiL (CAAX protease family)